MLRILGLLLFVVCPLGSYAQSPDSSFESLYEQGIAIVNSGTIEEAIEWLGGIEPEPSKDMAMLNLALARRLKDVNEHERSILILNEWFPILLNQFGSNHPHVRFAHFLRGQNLLALAQDEEAVTSILSAIEPYQNAIPLNYDIIEASYQILGRYYRQQASPEDAVHYWQLAAQLRADLHGVMDPERGVYLNYIAALRLEQEDWDQAEMLYLEARNIFLHAPKEARFWMLFVDKALVDLYMARKQYIQAARYSASYNFRVATIGLLYL